MPPVGAGFRWRGGGGCAPLPCRRRRTASCRSLARMRAPFVFAPLLWSRLRVPELGCKVFSLHFGTQSWSPAGQKDLPRCACHLPSRRRQTALVSFGSGGLSETRHYHPDCASPHHVATNANRYAHVVTVGFSRLQRKSPRRICLRPTATLVAQDTKEIPMIELLQTLAGNPLDANIGFVAAVFALWFVVRQR